MGEPSRDEFARPGSLPDLCGTSRRWAGDRAALQNTRRSGQTTIGRLVTGSEGTTRTGRVARLDSAAAIPGVTGKTVTTAATTRHSQAASSEYSRNYHHNDLSHNDLLLDVEI